MSKSKQAIVDDFNERHAIGDAVRVRMDNGNIIKAHIQSPACLLGDHTPVILLKGVFGCYLLDRVEVSNSITMVDYLNKGKNACYTCMHFRLTGSPWCLRDDAYVADSAIQSCGDWEKKKAKEQAGE